MLMLDVLRCAFCPIVVDWIAMTTMIMMIDISDIKEQQLLGKGWSGGFRILYFYIFCP